MKALQPIVIIGGGGHASDVLAAIEALNEIAPTFEVVGYLDDVEPENRRLDRRGVPHLGPISEWTGQGPDAVIGIGDPQVRLRVHKLLIGRVTWAAPIVHPYAAVSANSVLERGVVVLAGASVSAEATLRSHVHVSQQVAIGHDAAVGRFSSVYPGAVVSGEVEIGDAVMIGSNASILPALSIGSRARVGAGAVVTTNVPPDAVAVGVPATW